MTTMNAPLHSQQMEKPTVIVRNLDFPKLGIHRRFIPVVQCQGRTGMDDDRNHGRGNWLPSH